MNKLSQLLSQENGLFGTFFLQYKDGFYLLFRLALALLISLHGAQKAFLLWGFPGDHELSPLVDIAGWVEVFASVMIAFGILTRLAAGALTIQLAVAYFDVHFERGFWPHTYHADEGFTTLHHGGEIVILYFAVAGIIGILGSGKWGLERLIFKKEFL